MEKIKKNIFNFFQLIFILSFLFSLINCEDTYTRESMDSQLTGTIGIGVFFLILFLCISVLICIFGQSTSSPMLFILIGSLLSLIVFLILICVPVETDKEKDDTKNNKKNYYIIARYIYFIIMLLLFLGIVGPFIILWTTIIIPERVDSRAQKVYEEKLDEIYLSNLKEERKLMEENNEENNNQDLSLNNQLPLPRTFNSNTGHSSGLPALRRRNMNENNPGIRRRRRNNNENNFNNSNQDNNNIINNQ
jgi:uncharacterized Tic20 family protein